MSKAVERGPNYDWKHEAQHYREECEKLRKIVHLLELTIERNAKFKGASTLDYTKFRLKHLGELKKLESIMKELKHSAKRSSYGWSEGGTYTREDCENEGKIKLANELLARYAEAVKGTEK